MAINSLVLELPNVGTDGDVFEIFKSPYSYRKKKGTKLSTHPRGSGYIVGFVPKDKIPAEGGSFVMMHHNVSGVMNFGAITMEKCSHVTEEEGIIYFEDADGESKYILIPIKAN